jgi:hypothetical protein
MALTVSIGKSGQTTKYLKVERITHNFDRSVSSNPLPSGTEGTPGQVFILDLGQCVQTIVIEGLVDGAPLNPTTEFGKADLELVLKTWYIQYSLGGDNSPAFLTIPVSKGSTTSYSGFFKNASFTMVGALEDRWQFSILFYVAS